MRSALPDKLEDGRMAGKRSWGAYGQFVIQGPCGEQLVIVASGSDADDKVSEGWEHVSISTRRRCPNWQEMCFVKDLFWNETECVIQFHPPKADYVNNHAFCLHLWGRADGNIPRPPSLLVGVKDRGILTPAEARQIKKEMDGL
jgi:hypothetical protein